MKYLLPILAILACPEAGAQTVNCASNSGVNIACSNSETFPVVTRTFTATSGNAYEVNTSDLKNLSGTSNTVDTVLYVLNTNTGNVVATNDDGYFFGLASRVVFTASSSFTGLVVLAGYNYLRFGSADLTITNTTTSTTLANLNDMAFGGYHPSTSLSVKSGDRQFVGVAPDGADHTLFANTLFLFENNSLSCTSSCGRYVAGDSSVGGLARLTVPWTTSAARVLVGSALTTDVSTRWLNARLGSGWSAPSCPTSSGLADCDGDGLTVELESLAASVHSSLRINTCDSGTGPSSDCNAGVDFSSRSNFTARDTDNDGLGDEHEVFGVLRNCAQAPTAPYYFPGACTNATFGTPTGTWYALALSALDPNPRDTDVYVHVAPQATALGNNYWATGAGSFHEMVDYIYEEEGLECAENTLTSCGGTRYYVNTHLFQAPDVDGLPWDAFTPAWPAADYFTADTSATWQNRKYTGVFRYAQLITNGSTARTRGRYFTAYGNTIGGLAAIVGPPAQQAVTSVARCSTLFAHELGHSLGLGHGGLSTAGNFKVNYPSIMNYGYPGMAVKQASGSLWPSSFLNSCTTTCPAGSFCDTAIGLCVIDCNGAYKRFSRGVNPTVNEQLCPNEAAITTACATSLWCYINGSVSGQQFGSICSGGSCTVDWTIDLDTVDVGVPFGASMNSDTDVTDTGLGDWNDWELIYDLAGEYIEVVDGSNNAIADNLYESDLRVFQSGFEALAADDQSAFNHTITIDAGASVTAGGIGYGNAINFSGQRATVTSSAALRSLGVASTNPVVGTNGYRIDMLVRFDSLTPTPSAGFNGNELVRSSIFDLYTVRPGGGSDTFIQADLSSPTTRVTSSLALAINTWYWVTLTWSATDNLAAIYVVPRGATTWNFVGGACTTAAYTYTGSTDPGNVTFAEDPLNSTWFLDGLMDEPRIFNYPACLGFSVVGATPADPIQQVNCGSAPRACSSN